MTTVQSHALTLHPTFSRTLAHISVRVTTTPIRVSLRAMDTVMRPSTAIPWWAGDALHPLKRNAAAAALLLR